MNVKNIAETDLYRPVYEYFTDIGYTVKGEVNGCDVTATIDGELIVIELKKSLNMKLLIQSSKRQKVADLVYVAVIKPVKSQFTREWKDKFYLLRRLELGLIFVSFKGGKPKAEIQFHPGPFDNAKSKRMSKQKRLRIINEIGERHGDYNVGGSRRKKLMTAYRENTIHIACCLKKLGVLSPKQLKDLGTGDKTSSILNKNFYGWFNKVERGVYELNKIGEEALEGYPELVEHYLKNIDDNDQLEKKATKCGN